MSDAAAFFDKTSDAFDRHYGSDPDFRERLDVWRSLIGQYGVRGASFLDVGCGPGHLACHAAAEGMSAIGIDPSPAMLDLARARAAHEHLSATFEAGTLETLRSSGHRADLVVCSSVLEYLADLASSLSILRASVRPGGHLIVSLPNAACWYRRAETLVHAISRRPAYRALVKQVVTPEQLRDTCERAGLAMIDLRYFAHHHALRALNPLLDVRRRSSMFVAVLAVK